MAYMYEIKIINGSPVRVKTIEYTPDNIAPEFKTLPDYHQELLQESKRLNDIMHAAMLASPI